MTDAGRVDDAEGEVEYSQIVAKRRSLVIASEAKQSRLRRQQSQRILRMFQRAVWIASSLRSSQ
jgi:hypothetical protein